MTDFDNASAELDSLTRAALAWVVRLSSGTATTADAEALKRWCAQSPSHAAAFDRAVRLRHALRVAAQELTDEQLALHAPCGAPDPWRRITGRRALLGGAALASAAGYLIVRPPFGLWPSVSELAADYRTGAGEQRKIALADGIQLEINTQTSVAVQSPTGPERAIELISGEVAVAVRLGSAKSFVVGAADGRTIAEQAHFNVRHDGSTVSVSCLEGAVRVEQRGGAVALQARQQVSYDQRAVGRAVSVDPELVTAWRQGLLIFHDKPLAQVLAEVNRYRRGRIILGNSELGRLTVNGVFHLDRLDGVIDQMRKLGARVTTLPGGFILLS